MVYPQALHGARPRPTAAGKEPFGNGHPGSLEFPPPRPAKKATAVATAGPGPVIPVATRLFAALSIREAQEIAGGFNQD
jgi:hypothetical protein